MDTYKSVVNSGLSSLVLRVKERGLGALTYEECIALAQDCERFLKDLPVEDHAVKFFIEQRNSYYQYAEALDALQGNTRLEHCHLLPVMYSYADETGEALIAVPKTYRNRLDDFSTLNKVESIIIHNRQWFGLPKGKLEIVAA